MKVAYFYIDCCRECPYAEASKNPMIKKCVRQNEKFVVADEIDDKCPLDDETCEAK